MMAQQAENYPIDDSPYTFGSGGGGGTAVAQPYEDERILTAEPAYYNPAPEPAYYNPGIASVDLFDISELTQKIDLGGLLDIMKPSITPVPLDSLKQDLGIGSGAAPTATIQDAAITATPVKAASDNKKYYIVAIVIAIILALLLIK